MRTTVRTANGEVITAVQSGSAAVRLREARRFVDQFEPGAEVLPLGASRGSVDDLVRAFTRKRRDIWTALTLLHPTRAPDNPAVRRSGPYSQQFER